MESRGSVRGRAAHMLRVHAGNLVVSTQVLIELFNVCVRSLRMTEDDARSRVKDAARLDLVPADRSLVIAAAELAATTGLTIHDSMIVTAAERRRCEVVLTEDCDLLAADLRLATENPLA